MTTFENITVRPIVEDEYTSFLDAIRSGFGNDGPPVDTTPQLRDLMPTDRTVAAFDGDDIVGTFGGFDFELTVPGGAQVPMDGTTIVTVFPTHRRMGLLRAMMKIHLDAAAERGDPVAGLWSSDADIYARFGYGIASYKRETEMRSAQIDFRDEVEIDRVRRISAEAAAEAVPAVFNRIRKRRAGMYGRPEAWWKHRIIADEEWMRNGASSKRWVVHEGANGIDGYAAYRQKSGFEEGYADGTVVVIELHAENPRAHASLWSYLTKVDGYPTIEYWNLPVDDPLPRMVREPRRVRTISVRDALWIRVLDVVAALEARSYETDLAVTLGITDPFRPSTSGSYRVEVVNGSATVDRSDATADIEMDIDVLGSLYLGGHNANAFAGANRLTGSPDAIATTQRLFATQRAPWVQEIF